VKWVGSFEISVFSPFLNSDCTSEYFNRSGNIPDNDTLLNMYVNGDSIKGALAYRILSDISSYPCEVLLFNELIILLISYVVVVFNFI
jgi:hypothetical protein